ncbi:DUF3445 domain-containing protein [Nocardioides eburneiflavus]|uniref:DUF3445 domain-containing protein n=1 Tax=Nocardioides eburneiflavus TaxID=2518372 RepID=A0A4Z1CML3_9ACTN|nr:DUF3445 domain-containing protein [Nocardioides eburneiflavus]
MRIACTRSRLARPVTDNPPTKQGGQVRPTDFAATDVEHFPFPLQDDSMRPRVDVEPACVAKDNGVGTWGRTMFVVDHNYERTSQIRRDILEADRARFTAFPHMITAQWDAMTYIMRRLAAEYPDDFAVRISGTDWTWTNKLLDIHHDFVFGDADTLPHQPLEYIARQVQEDLLLLDVHEEGLVLDSALVTFSMAWSPTFTTGMTFHEAHGTIPRIMGDGTVSRAERFLMTMPPGEVYRRNPWSFQVGGRLDISMDTLPEWSAELSEFLAGDPHEQVGQRMRMRSEVSHFVRLPMTGVVLYTIRAQSITLEQLASVPAWARRTVSVIEEQPKDLAHHRGFTLYGPVVLPYLKDRLDSTTGIRTSL